MPKYEDSVLTSKNPVEINRHNYNDIISLLLDEMNVKVGDFDIERFDIRDRSKGQGSGWIIHRYINLSVDIFDIVPLRGSSYIPTPEKYSNPKCGLVNVRNDDDECFRWCMKYHQSEKKLHDIRTTALKKVEDKFDYSGREYPVTINSIKICEENNKVSVFVYEIDEDSGDSIASKKGDPRFANNIIYLLRVEDEDRAHFIYIKHIDRLLNLHHFLENKYNRFCPYCTCSVKLNEYCRHVSKCSKLALDTLSGSTIVSLPNPECKSQCVMKFKNYKNKLMRPFIAYADTECT